MNGLNEASLKAATLEFSKAVNLDVDDFVLLQDLCKMHRLAGKVDAIDEAIAVFRSRASD